MKRIFIFAFAVLLLLALTACGTGAGPVKEPESTPTLTPEPTPQATSVPEPAPQQAVEPPTPMGWASDEFMAAGINKVRGNPAAFKEFFMAYLEENAASIVAPINFSQTDIGRLLNISLTEEPQTVGENRILITYDQAANEEAGIKTDGGIFLDCMALLPAEQIPDSLLAFDKFITIMATPETEFYYEADIPGIRWIIDVICVDMVSGETRREPFDGGSPPYVGFLAPGGKYISGGFPLYQAVEYTLLLAETESGQPLPAPIPPPPAMSVSSPGDIDGEIADEYALRGEQQENGVPTRSLPLIIENAPEGTVCFALVMLDDMANGFVHWTAVNFTAAELPANASIDNAADMVQGLNDFGRLGYGGPAPTNEEFHSYSIIVYALDARLPLANGFSQDEFDKVYYEHVLDQSTLNIMYFN